MLLFSIFLFCTKFIVASQIPLCAKFIFAAFWSLRVFEPLSLSTSPTLTLNINKTRTKKKKNLLLSVSLHLSASFSLRLSLRFECNELFSDFISFVSLFRFLLESSFSVLNIWFECCLGSNFSFCYDMQFVSFLSLFYLFQMSIRSLESEHQCELLSKKPRKRNSCTYMFDALTRKLLQLADLTLQFS